MKTSTILLLSLLSSASIFASNTLIDQAKKSALTPIPSNKAELLKIIDPKNMLTDARIQLGKQLFFEPRLSKSGIISCNTCHNLGLGGTDGVEAAVGHNWTANPHHLNSPTVYNAVFASSQFWDGRSPNLEDQAQGPMQAEPEMAAPKALVEKRINSISGYVEAFKKAYGKDVNINFETITATIGLFERTLVTSSRYDDFLNGNDKALNPAEQKGLQTFIDKGCTSCHNGLALGGSMQPFPAVGKYTYANIGDFKGDKKGMIKVPTLRNITETAPYFHNGAIWSLSEAVKEMGTTQLGLKLSEKETADIVTFLKALKGEKPDMEYPQLPESSLTTPRPNFK